jgi:hypothetical protein
VIVIAQTLPIATASEAIRVVRALGSHRYVAGRLVLVHAPVFDALDVPEAAAPLTDAIAWARTVLSDPDVDASSKDERLFRTASAEELVSALEGFWTVASVTDRVQMRLMNRLQALDLEVGAHAPFDESAEDDLHPVLIDAGWELHPLVALDPVRHKGAIEAFDEPILFASARFEEENAIPSRRHLQELPAFGAVELLRGVDGDGRLIEPLVLWTEGNDTYQDYVLRGVLRAARVDRLPEPHHGL